jgi:hypothetical protein
VVDCALATAVKDRDGARQQRDDLQEVGLLFAFLTTGKVRRQKYTRTQKKNHEKEHTQPQKNRRKGKK